MYQSTDVHSAKYKTHIRLKHHPQLGGCPWGGWNPHSTGKTWQSSPRSAKPACKASCLYPS